MSYIATWMFLPLAATACGGGASSAAKSSQPLTLRIGVGQIATANRLGGLQIVANNLSFEGLVRIGPDGRPLPWLAKSWTVAADGLSIRLELRPQAKFHDGAFVTAAAVVQALRESLPAFMGSVFEDIDRIDSSSDNRAVIVTFKRPSPLLVEALEVAIHEPGAPRIGTGPFAAASSGDDIRANKSYYLGSPLIDKIVVTSYPSVRAAWAEMLRNNIDMLYEVGADALSSMQEAKSVAMFSFVRWYQYAVILNVRSPKFRSSAIRRALNAAIDRASLVRDAFDGHATPASGLVWPQNWAFRNDLEQASFKPANAASVLSPRDSLKFTCLVPPDYERIALVVKRQLAAVGVEMNLESVPPGRAIQALSTPSFEAVLTDIVGGPSLLRPYELWHSGGAINPGAMGSPQVDAALDQIRHAASNEIYRTAVGNFQKVTLDDPPAIYLAWGERARAVSERFDVPTGDPGRDILATLRLWKPVSSTEQQRASRN